jgi:hypothetical protein
MTMKVPERWFAELQRRCLDRGVFCSPNELITRTGGLDQDLKRQRPAFKRTKIAGQIIDCRCPLRPPR